MPRVKNTTSRRDHGPLITAALVRLLASDAGAETIATAAAETSADGRLSPAAIERLRARMTADTAAAALPVAERVAGVAEQLVLRLRGRRKFPHAERMLFERTLLEQASSDRLARYKARRFAAARNDSPPVDGTIWDLCCGLGGDALALATVVADTPGGGLVAVDQSAAAVELTRHNLAVAGPTNSSTDRMSCRCADVAEILVANGDLLHVDPDRRVDGRRTTQWDHLSPEPEVIGRLLRSAAGACVKLAPAMGPDPTDPHPLPARYPVEWEWLGDEREAKQLLLWTGRLAPSPGARSATVLASDGETADTLTATADGHVTLFRQSNNQRAKANLLPANPLEDQTRSDDQERIELRPGAIVHDPHAAVTAADLVDELAEALGGQRIAAGVSYLLGRPLETTLTGQFVVDQMLPFDRKRIAQAVRAAGIGTLEIKARGLEVDAADLARKLSGRAGQPGTLLIYPDDEGRTVSILAHRVPT